MEKPYHNNEANSEVLKWSILSDFIHKQETED